MNYEKIKDAVITIAETCEEMCGKYGVNQTACALCPLSNQFGSCVFQNRKPKSITTNITTITKVTGGGN